MRKLFYMGLESYEARYTLQLQEWNERVFKLRGIDYEVINGVELDDSKAIVTGSVLDAHGRTYYSLAQHMALIQKMKNGEVTSDDVIFYEDMYTPGLECLPYIMDQSPAKYRPKVFLRFLAQTTDPDDFLIREGMFDWMRKYEEMVDQFVDGIMVASEEFVAHLRIAGFKKPIYVTGLPYGKSEVLERTRIAQWCAKRGTLQEELANDIASEIVTPTKDLKDRTRRVCFASRWDDEKLPNFYMDLAQEYFKIDPTVEFSILCGHPKLKSNDKLYVERAESLQRDSTKAWLQTANFKIYTGLKKNEYYNLLADSQVLFNCALQDWVSNTVSEADTMGCLTLFPAYRSFPEVFANNANHMYVPWSIEDAVEKLQRMFNSIDNDDLDKYNIGKISDYQNGTIDRTIDCMLDGENSPYLRGHTDYRKHVTKAKYE